MNSYIIFKYVHLVAVITMICCLAVEMMMLEKGLLRSELKKLSRVDAVYGVAAIVAVAAGLTLWFGVGKGAGFYNNPVLHVKVGIVVVVGLISIVPTVYFIRNSKGDQSLQVSLPPYIRRLVIIQLLLLAIVPLLATMMANGLRF
jgi:putative membrane protein